MDSQTKKIGAKKKEKCLRGSESVCTEEEGEGSVKGKTLSVHGRREKACN